MKNKNEEHIPTYLENHVKTYQEEDWVQLTLCSSTGNDRLEVWYYGELREIEGEKMPYIVETDQAPELIVAKDPETGEEFLIHDGARYGYDNLFCETYDADAVRLRTLRRYPIPPAELQLSLTYSIDYEDEIEDYEIDDEGMVTLIDGQKIPWEEAKRNGMDFLGLYYRDEADNWVQFYDKELA